MERIIPVLPCSDADAQIEFYQNLGFTLDGKYTRGYLVFRYGDLELHFFGSKMFPPEGNPSMCMIQTDDLEQLYGAFISGIKAQTGKIPRTGFPKITKIRELSEDFRFTLADPSGNTIYVLQPKTTDSGTFFRDIDDERYAKKIAALYDLLYSKQDMDLAGKVLAQLETTKEQLGDLDVAKLLLLELEVQKGAGVSPDTSELDSLLQKHGADGNWALIGDKLDEILI